MQEQSSFHCKCMDEIEYDQNEKNIYIYIYIVALKKTEHSTIFPDLISIFQTFSRSGNFWAN